MQTCLPNASRALRPLLNESIPIFTASSLHSKLIWWLPCAHCKAFWLFCPPLSPLRWLSLAVANSQLAQFALIQKIFVRMFLRGSKTRFSLLFAADFSLQPGVGPMEAPCAWTRGLMSPSRSGKSAASPTLPFAFSSSVIYSVLFLDFVLWFLSGTLVGIRPSLFIPFGSLVCFHFVFAG